MNQTKMSDALTEVVRSALLLNQPQKRAVAVAMQAEMIWGPVEMFIDIGPQDLLGIAAANNISVGEFGLWAETKYPGIMAEVLEQLRTSIGHATSSAIAELSARAAQLSKPAAEGEELTRSAQLGTVQRYIATLQDLALTLKEPAQGDHRVALTHILNVYCTGEAAVLVCVGYGLEKALAQAIRSTEIIQATVLTSVFPHKRRGGRSVTPVAA